MRRLRAIRAIFRTSTGLDRQQRGELNRVGVEVFAMHSLRAKQQVVERQVVERDDIRHAPASQRLRCGGLSGGLSGFVGGLHLRHVRILFVLQITMNYWPAAAERRASSNRDVSI